MPDAIYDVAIIGGGPAGSATAGLLACAGRRVIVFERERFPRFHIGESLLPFSMKALTRLGLHEKISARRVPENVRGRNHPARARTLELSESRDGRLSSVRQCVVH
jgi:2-polyprenyl-6-methoxyphenol hydroxylase-like FAD-dependent oxidoreductase